jgi:hypothetical protein
MINIFVRYLERNFIIQGDNEPDRLENATHNTLVKQTCTPVGILSLFCFANVLWVAFSKQSGSLLHRSTGKDVLKLKCDFGTILGRHCNKNTKTTPSPIVFQIFLTFLSSLSRGALVAMA